jgi:hypothetical protein
MSRKLSLFEILFNTGKDIDWPARESKLVIVFSPNDTYKVQGNTHEAISHAIKHADEFFPEKVKQLLEGYRELLKKYPGNLFIKTTSDKLIASGKKSLPYLDSGDEILLNTLDRINDKIQNGIQLTHTLEQRAQEISELLEADYSGLLNKVIGTAVAVDEVTDKEVLENLVHQSPIKFSGEYRGHKHDFIYDNKLRAIISFRDDGSVNTFFKINDSFKPGEYVSKGGKISNSLIVDVLNSVG